MSARERILPPYTRRVEDTQHRIVRLVAGLSVVLLAVLFGFVIGVFGLVGWFIPTIPVVLMALVALWMAPDVDTHADRLMARLYFLFVAVLLVWPSYLALNLPGLPWISFQRIAMFLLAAVSLYAIATSSRLRGEFGDILASHKWMKRLFLTWVVWQTLMLGVGRFLAMSRWVDTLFTWYFMFLITAWVMTRPGAPQLLVKLVLLAIAVTAGIAIPESRVEHVLWSEHIPAFLSINPEIMNLLQYGTMRVDYYRAVSIFIDSLSFAEYLGMLMPFCLLAISWSKSGWRFVAAVALLMLMLLAGYLTHARTAMVASFSTIPAFIGLWLWRRYRLTAKDRDLIAPALLSLFPAGALTLLIGILTVGRLRGMVLGDGSQDDSDAARGAQWDMAIPKILRNPVGHGMGSLEEVVPYHNLAGKFTIDSYPINLFVEYGVLGFVVFTAFFALAAGMGAQVYRNAEGRDELVAGAAAVGIMSFMISRLVLSADGSVGLAFGYAGIILGLWFVQKRRLQQPAAAEPGAAGR